MVTVRIMLLEVGYESNEEDTFSNCQPPMKELLKSNIRPNALSDWVTESDYDIPDVFHDDKWVRQYLQDRFDSALVTGNVLFKDCHLRRYPKATGDFSVATFTGSPGTQCKLRGDEWVNSRSYVIMTPDGCQWPQKRHPENAIVFATLTWRCP